METYVLIVIGSGPAGQRAAIQAANNSKRAALNHAVSGLLNSYRGDGANELSDREFS